MADIGTAGFRVVVFVNPEALAAAFGAVGFFVATACTGVFLTEDAGFFAAAVLAGAVRARTVFLAATFLLVAAVAPFSFRAVADFRGAATRVPTFMAARFVPAVLARVAFGFAALTGAAFGRATLTSPRMARPVFAVAFGAGRRFGLLREVEAMGTTLVTVATWGNGQWQATQERLPAPPRPVDTGE